MKRIKSTVRASRQLGRFLAKHWKYALREPSFLKYFPRWWKTLDPYSTGFLPVPFLTYSSIDWLESVLSPEMVGFEYGAGASTLYLSSRLKSLVSVEHDRSWYDNLIAELRERNISNCDCRLAEAESINGEAPEYSMTSYTAAFRPDIYGSKSFKKYVSIIDEFDDGHFDMVFVDGRARASCIRHALPKIRDGGYLVLDNSEREVYRPALTLLDSFERKDYFGIGPVNTSPWQTTTWKIVRDS